MSEITEAEILKAKAWYEQDLRPRMKTGEGKSIPELLAEYGRHIAAEKDAELAERVAVVVERELDIEEAILADPLTKRRLKAQRIARQVIAAMKGE